MSKRKDKTLSIAIKSTYCQLFLIEVISKCLEAWGWSIQTTENGIEGTYEGFKNKT